MGYYAIVQKKGRGSHLGEIEGFVYDRFVPKNEEVITGEKPWYSGVKDEQGHVLVDNMHYITPDRLVNFDIRRKSRFYIMSINFVELLELFSITLKEIKPLKVVSRNNIKNSEKEYFAVILPEAIYFDQSAVLEKTSVFIEDFPHIFFHEIHAKNNLTLDLFKIKNIVPHQDTLFCSEKFKQAALAHKIHGIDFINVEDFPWKDVIQPNYYFDCLLKGKEFILAIG